MFHLRIPCKSRAPRLACPWFILPPSHCSPAQAPRGDAAAKSEPILHNIFRNVFDSPSFLLALPHKDIALATELGREFKVPMPIANLAEQIAIAGLNRG
jgi:hypothetical protein